MGKEAQFETEPAIQVHPLDKLSVFQRVHRSAQLRQLQRSLRSLRLRCEKGVTLIELLAVIAIMAVIAAVAIPVVSNSMASARENTTKQNLQLLAEALQRYNSDNAGYPASAGLQDTAQVTGFATDLHAYIQGIPQDGDQKDFTYDSDGSKFEIISSNGFYITSDTSSPQSGNAPNFSTVN